MRLLWARVGVPYSPATGLPIEAQTVSQMVDRVLAMEEGTRLLILAPVIRGKKGEYRKELAEFQRRGFERVKINGALHRIEEAPKLDKKLKHDIEVVVDRIVVRADGMAQRLADSFETALRLADGIAYAENADTGERTVFSQKFACPESGFSIEEIEPRLFSFNSPQGACPECDGLGVESFFDPSLVVPERGASLKEGAIAPWAGNASTPYYDQTLVSLAKHLRIGTEKPWEELPAEARDAILHGTGAEPVTLRYKDGPARLRGQQALRGRDPQPRAPLPRKRQPLGPRGPVALPGAEALPRLPGFRLKPQSLAVKVAGCHIGEASALSIRRARDWFGGVYATLTPQRQEIARRILKEIEERLQFLVDVGLDYLSLARSSATLSGGSRSASAWRARSAPASPACSTCWTSRPSACTSATTSACW
jgi:excinuclease ABC subunit A